MSWKQPKRGGQFTGPDDDSSVISQDLRRQSPRSESWEPPSP